MRRLLGILSSHLRQPDKALHAAGGFIVGLAAGAASGSPVVGDGLGFVLAWAKERYDKAHADRHTWDGWDAFATAAGASLGSHLGAHLGHYLRGHQVSA